MNRQQRRAAERANAKQQKKKFSYEQGLAIATEAYKHGQKIAYEQKQDADANEHAEVFMYTFGLIIKVLHEQWGWGYTRLSRLTNQLLEEYNNNDMSAEELEKWCWEYGGFKLQIDDEAK